MTKRENIKDYIIYPENKYKSAWDLWMTLVLVFTCIQTPLNIAFNDLDNSNDNGRYVDYVIDFLFFIDILVIFNSAFYNDDSEIIDDRKEIARSYAKGWFVVDVLAIVPFDAIINANDYN